MLNFEFDFLDTKFNHKIQFAIIISAGSRSDIKHNCNRISVYH